MTQRIFISYRRQDSRGDAGRIYDRLRPEFGEAGLFMDVAHIPLGVNFVRVLREEVTKCQVLLAVIGPGWLEARDDDGSRRLDNPNDFVRVEIAAALARDIPVVPILLEGTKMPKASLLPADLQELAQRNGLDVRHVSFHADIDRLIAGLGSVPKIAPIAPRLASRSTPPLGINPIAAPPPPLSTVTANVMTMHQPPPSVRARPLHPVRPAEWVISAKGHWLRHMPFDRKAAAEPSVYRQVFVHARQSSGIIGEGAILTGRKWYPNLIVGWTIIHGYSFDVGSDGTGYGDIEPEEVTYLGPTWRPEYAQLSDEVFKRLGGKPLERFITHP